MQWPLGDFCSQVTGMDNILGVTSHTYFTEKMSETVKKNVRVSIFIADDFQIGRKNLCCLRRPKFWPLLSTLLNGPKNFLGPF